MLNAEEALRLEELKDKPGLSAEEQAELASLQKRPEAADLGVKKPEEKPQVKQAKVVAKGGKASATKGAKPPAETPAADHAEKTDPALPRTEPKQGFDTAGATHVVTMRDSKAVKVWFRDGKEIGAEDAG